MSPWNYPFLLTMDPLVDALAAGNTAVVKPSAYSPYTGAVIQEIVHECFDEKYVTVVTGGRAENTCLLEEAIAKINSMPHPLALYIFTGDKKAARKVISQCGFGGFGESGMGSYHGKAGFSAFSHEKSIVDKKTWLDLPMRYQPYKEINNRLIHFFLK